MFVRTIVDCKLYGAHLASFKSSWWPCSACPSIQCDGMFQWQSANHSKTGFKRVYTCFLPTVTWLQGDMNNDPSLSLKYGTISRQFLLKSWDTFPWIPCVSTFMYHHVFSLYLNSIAWHFTRLVYQSFTRLSMRVDRDTGNNMQTRLYIHKLLETDGMSYCVAGTLSRTFQPPSLLRASKVVATLFPISGLTVRKALRTQVLTTLAQTSLSSMPFIYSFNHGAYSLA